MTVRVRAFLILVASVTTHAFFDEAVDVLRLSKEIGEEVLESWDIIGKPFNVSGGVELPITRRRERLVLSRLAHISRAIQRLELGIEKNGAVAMLLAKASSRGAKLELRLHEMADLLSRVTSADRQMREYVRLQRELEQSTLQDFAEWCVSHDRGALAGLLERVHSLIAPPYKHLLGGGLLQLILDDLQGEHPDLCELQLSSHQLIYDMYNTISLTEIKGYAMMQFSWMLLRIYGKGNFTQEASLTRQRYGERTSRTAAAARAALKLAGRHLYRCDPPRHVLGETYAEVTKLLQGYIENEVDMNSEGTCRENCPFYSLTERHSCIQDMFCSKQPPCKGRIIDCKYIDSDMWICRAPKTSNRRYEWIEYENGRILGKADKCTRGTTKVDSWWRWIFWHCSYCMCICDEAGPNSHRYFSLWDTTSDVKNNKSVDSWWKWTLLHCSYCFCLCEDDVSISERTFSLREALADVTTHKVVTGLRIVKHGRVFHLQISEGTLGERGSVTPGGWVPLQKFDISDAGVREGEDYHTLTYEKRAIDLDELDSPSGHVLTGVRFRMIGAHLHFEIRSTPFNYTTGRLAPDRSQWISNDNTEGAETPRRRLELYMPDLPTRSETPLPVDSTHDQYVEFTHSDLDADAAQSTVPFIDIQPLEPSKGGALLSGAGVIHRGARGSGGFLAAELITYDYSPHVKAELPPNSFEDTEAELPLLSSF